MKPCLSFFIAIAGINFCCAERPLPDSAVVSKKFKQYSVYEVYFNTGYALPVGSFGSDFLVNPDAEFESSLKNSIGGDSGGFNARSSFSFDFGITYFMAGEAPKPIFGLRTTFFSYTPFPFKWESDSDYVFNEATYKALRIISMRTGPMMRLYTKSSLQFDLYYQLGIAFGSHAAWNYSKNQSEYYNGYTYYVKDNADFKMTSGFGLMHEAGAAVSYHALKAGISFNFGSLKYDNVEYYRHIEILSGSSQSYLLYADDTFDVKAPVSYLKFFVGLRVGD